MADKALRGWVEDQLYALLGLSERALAEYCISLAKRAKDASSLAATLEGQASGRDGVTRQFAAELLARAPRGGGGGGAAAAAAAQRERDAVAAAMARKSQQYALLPDEEDEAPRPKAAQQPAPPPPPPPAEAGAGGRGKGKSLRPSGRRRGEEEGGGEDDTVVRRKSRKRAWEEDEEAEDAEAAEARRREAARELDRQEKEEFEQRLREKDEAMPPPPAPPSQARTRKLAERKVGKAELAEMERRRAAEEAEDRAATMRLMRDVSRQEYLKKREDAKLEELKEALEDEKYLFQGVKLSERERRELAYKEEVYRLAAERKKQLEELEHDDSYHMPAAYDEAGHASDKRYEVLTARYRSVG
eukprot:scaffold36.g5068.t1